jgi:hypothetical protein
VVASLCGSFLANSTLQKAHILTLRSENPYNSMLSVDHVMIKELTKFR